MSFVTRVLDRLFPREELPWGTRWRLYGRWEPRADYSRCLLKLGARKPLPGEGLAPETSGRYLHRMVRGDLHRDHHDHPYAWTSIVLMGGYIESLLDPRGVVTLVFRRLGSIAFRGACEAHTVEKLLAPVTWTLFLTGPRKREWGFWRWKHGTMTWTQHETYRREIGYEENESRVG